VDADELKSAISANEPLAFCREELFSDQCWAFSDESDLKWRGTYRQFRNTIGSFVNTNPNNIAIVGSARFGLSLNPDEDKALKPFRKPAEDKPSDLDVVIVHPELFEEIWSNLRQAYYSGYKLVRAEHGRECFFKFLSLRSDIEYDTTFLDETKKLMMGLVGEANKSHGVDVELNYRIYDSWKSAEDYYSSSIEDLQRIVS
jgi:hypothetical protein